MTFTIETKKFPASWLKGATSIRDGSRRCHHRCWLYFSWQTPADIRKKPAPLRRKASHQSQWVPRFGNASESSPEELILSLQAAILGAGTASNFSPGADYQVWPKNLRQWATLSPADNLANSSSDQLVIKFHFKRTEFYDSILFFIRSKCLSISSIRPMT